MPDDEEDLAELAELEQQLAALRAEEEAQARANDELRQELADTRGEAAELRRKVAELSALVDGTGGGSGESS